MTTEELFNSLAGIIKPVTDNHKQQTRNKMKHLKEKQVDLKQLKYVRVTDKITILVPCKIPDDEARQEFLLKIAARDRGYQKKNEYE